MQAQVPRDPYVNLWSRLRAFDPTELEGLFTDRQVVRMTLMRTTLHLVTAGHAANLRAVMQGVCERGFKSSPFARNIADVDRGELLAAATAALEERPLSTAELGNLLAERWPGRDKNSLAYAARFLLPLVQVLPRGLFRQSAAPRVTTLRAWLGNDTAAADADGTSDTTVLRYLRAFGPATIADIRTWSWLTNLRPVIDRLRPQLRSYRNERGQELLDVDDGVFAAPETPAPVRFLAEYDNIFLSHADRTRITGETTWGAAYARRGTFFVDGFLAGAWRPRGEKGRVTLRIQPVVPIPASTREEVVAEAEAVLELLEPEAVRSVEFGDLVPLRPGREPYR